MAGSPRVGRAALLTPVLGCAVAVGGLLVAHGVWWQWLIATAGVAVAQSARLFVRIGTDGVTLAWGEAGAILALCLVPPAWVPAATLAGAALSHGYRMVGTDRAGRARVGYGIGVLTLGGTAGAAAMLAAGRLPVVVGLCLAGLAYYAVTTGLTSIWVASVQGARFGPVWRRAAGSKRLMALGNIAIGLGVGLLVRLDLRWLVLVPPVIWLVHQVYQHRFGVEEERRTWQLFAEVTRGLTQLDGESAIVAAGLRGAGRLFRADRVELVLRRPSGRCRRYLSTSECPQGTWFRRPLDGGELLIGYRRKIRLSAREEHAFSAYADAVSSALHDAATHRQLRAMTERSAFDAVHDPLTGLPHRSSLLARGNAELRRLPPGTPVALILLDVDGFRDVNDTLGHAAGDELLRVLAARLLAARGEGEILGRLGGDEYALLLTGRYTDPMARARMITMALGFPTEIAGITLALAVSAGVVAAEAGACDMSELLRRADVALYRAKAGGWGTARYAIEYDAASPDRLALLAELRDALATTEQIHLVLHPAVDLATGAPTGVEALARWRHPRRGVLAPAEFIGAIEQSDLVGGFTRYVLDRALGIAAAWAASGVDVPIAVNLSARSLLDPDLPTMVADCLAIHGVPPARLILEITETVVTSDPATIDDVLAALRKLGVQVSVDDFGTGGSSLTFLTRVPVDEVKIDRTFVARMADSPEAAAIVRTTVDLARELGLRVVAEGVETAQQRAVLTEWGATAAQGFLFFPVMGVEQTTAVLQDLRRP